MEDRKDGRSEEWKIGGLVFFIVSRFQSSSENRGK
jgi:hypothetical protein